MTEELLRLFCALVLLVAPGAWISIWVAKYLQFNALTLSVVLSPLVLVAEFYLLRFAGLSFEVATYAAVGINLPAFFWLTRDTLKWGKSESSLALKFRLVLLAFAVIPISCLFLMHIFDAPWRYFSAHPWMHADFVYAIANGALVPEEPGLAGVRVGYPYLAHICQAMVSFLLDSPPQSSYIWSNLTWAICLLFLVDGAAKRIGCGIRGRVFTFLFLFFGLDGFSFACEFVLPESLVESLRLGLGWRYSPWCWKLHSFDQMPMSLAIFAATLVLLMGEEGSTFCWRRVTTVTALCVSQALFYPILFPISLALVGLRFLIHLFQGRQRGDILKEAFFPIVVSVVVLLIWIRFITASHVDGQSIRLHTFSEFRLGGYRLLVASVLLMIGLFSVRRSLKQAPQAAWMLLGCLFTSSAMNVIFFIPWLANEYKFLFTMAFCAAPFCGAAIERWLPQRAFSWIAIAGACCLIMSTTVLRRVAMRDDNTKDFPPPLVDTSTFDMRLDSSDVLAGPLDAVRESSPSDALFVYESVNFHALGITQRSSFIPPTQERGYAGYGIQNLVMLRYNVGYSHKLIDERSELLYRFFTTAENRDPQALLKAIESLGRSAVILLEKERHAHLISWFKNAAIGHEIFDDERHTVLVVDRP